MDEKTVKAIQSAAKIEELREKIDYLEKHESASKFYIKNMRGALAGIEIGDVNSALRFLISALLEPK